MLVVLMVSMMPTVALMRDRVPFAMGYEPAEAFAMGSHY